MSEKTCTRCGLTKPANSHNFTRCHDKFRNPCRACRRKTPIRDLSPVVVGIEGAIGIPLTRGAIAIVDTCDIDLAEFQWFTSRKKNGYSTAVRRLYATNDAERFALTHMHRVILERMLNRSLNADEYVDHIDRNPLNNRRSNLRLANADQNARNKQKPRIGRAKSQYKGVNFSENKFWTAHIRVDGKDVFLGVFDTEVQAGIAYNHAAAVAYREFAYFNDIQNWQNTHVERRTIPITNTSGYKGVYFDKRINKWMSLVGKKRIGSFASPEQAYEARQQYIEELAS